MFVPQVWFYGVAVVSAGRAAGPRPLPRRGGRPAAVQRGRRRRLPGLRGPRRTRREPRPRSARPPGPAGPRLGTTAGVVALALCTAVPLARLGSRLRPSLHFAPGDARVVGRDRCRRPRRSGPAAGQRAGRSTWPPSAAPTPARSPASPGPTPSTSCPYAVLAAPVLQLTFPRLAAAAEHGARRGRVTSCAGPRRRSSSCPGWARRCWWPRPCPVARVFVLGPGSGRTEALAGPGRRARPGRPRLRPDGPRHPDPAGPAPGPRRGHDDRRSPGGPSPSPPLVAGVRGARPASLVVALAGSVSLGPDRGRRGRLGGAGRAAGPGPHRPGGLVPRAAGRGASPPCPPSSPAARSPGSATDAGLLAAAGLALGRGPAHHRRVRRACSPSSGARCCARPGRCATRSRRAALP